MSPVVPLPRLALELDVLVARGARHGRLPIGQLLETYVSLMPRDHAALADPRRVSVDALVQALNEVPPGLMRAPHVYLVPRLEDFACQEVPSRAARAAVLADGTMLLEVRDGHAGLMRLAATLCALAHELAKASTLTGAIPSQPDASAERDTNAQEVAELESTHHLAHLAFHCGTTERELTDIDVSMDGAVLPLLRGEHTVPVVHVHAGLSHHELVRTGRGAGEKVLARLQEYGLLGRPVHLWVGSPFVVDSLSPYSRDLASTLLQWADANEGLLGEDVAAARHNPGEDLLYAVSQVFLAQDPALPVERSQADAGVGVYRGFAGLPVDVVDLGRLDPRAVDSRLTGLALPLSEAPILVRLEANGFEAHAGMVRSVLEGLGSTVRSITVLQEGTIVGADAGALVLPHTFLTWAGGARRSVPPAQPSEVFESFADTPVQRGVVLCAPAVELLSADQLASYGANLVAIQVGGAEVVESLLDEVDSGRSSALANARFGVVGSELGPHGRPTLRAIGAQAAFGIGRLRELFQAYSAPRAPPHDRSSINDGPSRAARVMRIKA